MGAIPESQQGRWSISKVCNSRTVEATVISSSNQYVMFTTVSRCEHTLGRWNFQRIRKVSKTEDLPMQRS